MSYALTYADKTSDGHIPSAENYSRADIFSAAAAFPAVATTYPGAMPAQTQLPIQRQGENASMPAQMSGGWLYSLMQTIIQHPVITGGTLLVAFGGLAYYLRQRRIQQREERAPVERLTPIATLFGVDPQELVNHLNQDEDSLSPEDVEKFTKTYFEHPQTKHNQHTLPQLGLIPSKLIKNLPEDDAGKMDTLFERFNAYGFNYTGVSLTALEGFMNRQGDCKTLVRMLVAAAHAAGLEDADIISDGRQVLVEKHHIHGRDATGNVYGKFCWYFDEHHQCTQGGQIYDALFMRKSSPRSRFYQETKTYKKVSYMVFDGGWCMIPEAEIAKMHIDLEDGEMGFVITGEERMMDYIDRHRR